MEPKLKNVQSKKYLSYKLLWAVGVFLILLLLTQFLAYQQLNLAITAQTAARNAEAVAVKERLEATIKSSVAATSALGFIVEHYGVPKDFEEVGKILLSGTKSIDALEILDSGTITHVYPLSGNEAVIGYNILADPSRNKEALMAIEKGELYFAGPIKLRQGGIGILGRLPLYREGRFIGFSAVLIKLNTFINSSGISDYMSGIYRYQLVKEDVNTGLTEQFFPGEKVEPDELSTALMLEEGNWKLLVQNRASLGWQAVKWISLLGIVLAIFGGILAYRLARRPEQLRLLVDEKSEALGKERLKFKNSFAHSYFGKALIHIPNKNISDYNPRFLEILGLDEFKIWKFWEMEWTKSDRIEGESIEFRIEHKDRHIHWISMNITPLRDSHDEYTHICTLFDITSEKNLQLNLEQAFLQRNEILESIGDAFFSLDRDMNITYWNRQAENLLIHKREMILGKNLLDIFGEFINLDDIKGNAHKINMGQSVHFKQHIPRLEKWFDVHIYPFSQGTAVYFSDNTETVRYMAAIEKRNEKLSEISWIQSHVVRAPLARIMGIINLLEMEEIDEKETLKLRKQLLIAAHELDAVLYEIIEKAHLIESQVKETLNSES